jgi:hypothetical protein
MRLCVKHRSTGAKLNSHSDSPNNSARTSSHGINTTVPASIPIKRRSISADHAASTCGSDLGSNVAPGYFIKSSTPPPCHLDWSLTVSVRKSYPPHTDSACGASADALASFVIPAFVQLTSAFLMSLSSQNSV